MNGEKIDVSNYNSITSPKGRGGRYFYIAVTEDQHSPYFEIRISHSSQGVAVAEPLSYTYNGGERQGRYFLKMHYSKV